MATALQLTRKGWKPYIDKLSKRRVRDELSSEERKDRERLVALAKEAAAMLKSRFAVRRVILFGSLAHASWFMPDSDVDLVIEGLKDEEYWKAWKLVEEIIGDRPVDFIALETVGESLRRAIERHGVEL
ncbi:MAG: nucleotidyltransferase domain-containing protein [Deltaproteobacteria bacterium]|nr:nucleotidyltransferase domain-containing protein [Deltaproteobacteria bacterium]